MMEELKAKLEKPISDAAECDLIASLAVEKDKREIFRSLGAQYRSLADAVRNTIAERTGK